MPQPGAVASAGRPGQFCSLLRGAQQVTSADRKARPAIIEQLALFEQKLANPRQDSRVFVRNESNLPHVYRPEAGSVFRLKAVLVKRGDVHVWTASSLPVSLRQLFLPTHDSVLLLVHPQSLSYYRPLLTMRGVTPCIDSVFYATPTASSRTLLAWKDGSESKPFCVKVSLDAVIGEVHRTIPSERVCKCVGLTQMLARASDIPPTAVFWPEYLGVAPHCLPRGGMLLRGIPPSAIGKPTLHVPLFALTSDPRGFGEPLLVTAVRNSSLDVVDWLRVFLLQPFARDSMHLATLCGITMEPHAQNVLIEMTKDFRPTGRLAFRDLEDICVDIPYRSVIDLIQPVEYPTINGWRRDYHQHNRRQPLIDSLSIYFERGVLWQLTEALLQWRSSQLLRIPHNFNSRTLTCLFRAEVRAWVRDNIGVNLSLRSNPYDDLAYAVARFRARKRNTARHT